MLEAITLIAAKVEAVVGTAETVAATDAQFNTYQFTMPPDEPENEREGQAHKGSDTSSPGAQGGKCSFEVELTGNGSAGVPPWASVFLPACDWENTAGTFAAVNGTKTLTIVAYEDGFRRQLTGARGTFTITAVNGKPARVKFDFTGKYSYTAETDAVLLTPTFPTVLAPVFAGSTISVGGSYAPILSTVTFAAGNNVVLREDAGHADKSGYRAAEIPRRGQSMCTMDPEQVSVATRAWRDLLAARTEETISVVIGSSANNTITIASSRAQTVKTAVGARNGIRTRNVSFRLNGASPFTLAFS